jgi:crotonobetainyl-CoA:carnitine CoA-transferase CaiB-like acyl-CoA transferase
MAGVFEGVRVVDMTSGTAGPMTAMMLADMGADVVRTDRRGVDPVAVNGSSRVWNRGKRSVEADLRDDDGRAFFLELVAAADVVVQDLAPGVALRLGVDHESLSAQHRRLITCSITGYGDHPDHRDRPGYDALVAARTGLLFDQKGRRGGAMEYISRRPGPLPEFDAPEGLVRGADRPGPVFPRSMWPSVGATYFGTLGVAAALRARAKTGRGQLVEASLLQGALAAVCLNWQRVEDPEAPLYWMWPTDGRSIEGLYECADGRWVHHWTIRPTWVLACAEGDVLTPPALDGAYRDDPDRVSMEPDGLLTGIFLHPQLAEAFKKFPSDQWIAAAAESLMGVALVRSPAEALADPAYLEDGCVVEVEDRHLGRIRHCGPLLEFSRTPSSVRGPAPAPGGHTDEVRAEIATTEPTTRAAATGSLDHPLGGVLVLDLGLGVAGPFAGRVLADLGADVIKIHAVYDGFWAGTHMGLGTNRGKRSIALNLKKPAGRAVLDRLIERADVVTTNWRPGAAARLGLDYETLSARYPRLVYCNSRGYERGARAHLPGTDQTAAALVGTEWADGACDSGNPPLWSRSNMGDTGNALLSAIAITAALYDRERTGLGQQVGTSIVNAGLLHTSYAWIHADGSAGDWGQVDAAQYGLSPCYRLYECRDDSWLFVAAVKPSHRQALCAAIGEPDAILDDPAKLTSALEHHLATRSAGGWFDTLDGAGVPVEVVDEEYCRRIFDDPHAREAQLISQTWAGAVGRFEDPGLLVTLRETPGIVQRGPSMCGEHTRELLLEYGYTSAEIDALVEDKAVLDAPVAHP